MHVHGTGLERRRLTGPGRSERPVSELLCEAGLLPRWLARLAVAAPLRRALGLARADAVYRRDYPVGADVGTTLSWLLDYKGLEPGLSLLAGIDRVPRSGPLLVVANHPQGLMDGLLLAGTMWRHRDDVRVLANRALTGFRELAPLLLGVDKTAGRTAVMRAARRHLACGGCVIAFPAGTVEHFHWRSLAVREAPWQPSVLRLAARTHAHVARIHIGGSNSIGFHLAAALSRRARTALLLREFLRCPPPAQTPMRVVRSDAPGGARHLRSALPGPGEPGPPAA